MERVEPILPQMLSFDALNKILIGFLAAGGEEQPVYYKEVAHRTGIADANISRNTKFLVSTGLVHQEKRGHYQLTDLGAKYAQTLDWGREEDARECLKKLLSSSPFFAKIVDYVRINKKVSRDDLLTAVATMAHVPKKSTYVTGINAVIDMLLYASLLLEKEDVLKLAEKEVVPIKLAEEPREELIEFVIETEHYAVEKAILRDFIKNHGKRILGEHYHL